MLAFVATLDAAEGAVSAVSDADGRATGFGLAEGLTREIAVASGKAVGDVTAVRQLATTSDTSRNKLNQPNWRIAAMIRDLQPKPRDVATPCQPRAAFGQYPDSS
jgi:hypothetical protein